MDDAQTLEAFRLRALEAAQPGPRLNDMMLGSFSMPSQMAAQQAQQQQHHHHHHQQQQQPPDAGQSISRQATASPQLSGAQQPGNRTPQHQPQQPTPDMFFGKQVFSNPYFQQMQQQQQRMMAAAGQNATSLKTDASGGFTPDQLALLRQLRLQQSMQMANAARYGAAPGYLQSPLLAGAPGLPIGFPYGLPPQLPQAALGVNAPVKDEAGSASTTSSTATNPSSSSSNNKTNNNNNNASAEGAPGAKAAAKGGAAQAADEHTSSGGGGSNATNKKDPQATPQPAQSPPMSGEALSAATLAALANQNAWGALAGLGGPGLVGAPASYMALLQQGGLLGGAPGVVGLPPFEGARLPERASSRDEPPGPDLPHVKRRRAPDLSDIVPGKLPKRRKTKKMKHASSKYRGVSWHRRDRRWMARVWIKGKIRCLGNYTNEKKAALAIDDVLIKAYGPTADLDLNFPTPEERREAELDADS